MWGQKHPLGVSEIPRVEGQLVLQIVQNSRVTSRRGYREAAPRTPRPINNISDAAFNGNQYSPEGWKRALGYFSAAIQIEPVYASAWAGVADNYYQMPSLVLPPCEAIPKARAAAIRALELDETLAEAHASLGVIKAYDWDGPSAEKRTSHPLVKIFMRHHTSYRSRGAPLGIPV